MNMNSSSILLSCLVIFMLGICGQTAQADNLKVLPFALFERSGKSLIVDGVSTKYALGVLGVRADLTFQERWHLSGKLGYGQSNNQTVEFSGAVFEGQVKGMYLQGGAQYNFLETPKYDLFGLLNFINRDLQASDLIGTRNGMALTGSSRTKFNSKDLTFGTRHKIGRDFAVSFSGGVSQWHLRSKAIANYSSGRITATATKNINTTGQDPIYKIGMSMKRLSHNFNIEISQRLLSSQISSNIATVRMDYQIKFYYLFN